MAKEVKIGLAVIGVLLSVFAGVLAMRLKKEQPASALEKVAAAEKAGKIGHKKKSAKTVKEGKPSGTEQDGASTSLDQPLSSRSRRGRSPAEAKTDRYGRPVENDWTLPKDDSQQVEPQPGEPPADNADNAISPLDPPDAAETDAPADTRYNRYADSDPLQQPAADRGEMPLEEPSREDGSPADRFAQMPGGLSLSDDEPAAEPSEPADGVEESLASTDEPADDISANAEPDTAPRLSVPSSGGLSFNDQPEEPLENVNQEEDRMPGDARLRAATAPDDEASDAEPLAADRSAERLRRRQGDSAMLTHEEPLDDSPAADEPSGASVREPWREPASGSYTVAANDNFWRISQKVYGTGAYFKALEEHNRRQLGGRGLLNVGDVVSTPPQEELRRDYPDLSPKPREVPGRRRTALASSGARGGRTYTVSEGDTLFDIAREELGKASRWAEIYEINREQLGNDFNYLTPGMRLALPARGGGSDPIATRPDRDSYRR